MADDFSASVIPLHQVPPKPKDVPAQTKDVPAKAKTAKAKAAPKADAEPEKPKRQRKPRTPKAAAPAAADETAASALLIPAEFSSAHLDYAEPPVAQLPVAPPAPVALRVAEPIAPRRRSVAPVLLSIAALALAGVGITMNGLFARSLGSSDIAGWLFLAVGVAADLVALVMPSCAAALWQAEHRATSLVGWSVWAMTFVFAVTAGIGFASVNIADVTLSRATRATPAIHTAQATLDDAIAARDRECKGGVGKFCREREATVNERRQALDAAMHSVEKTADPQTDAAIRIVAWVSRGAVQPTENDFAMLRLVLLALLPQIGGILLMVGRHRA